MTRLLPAVLLAVLLPLPACADGPPAAVSTSPSAEPTLESAADVTPTDPESVADPATRAAFRRIMGEATAGRWHALPYGETVQRVAESLLGTPYRDHLLDQSDEELLVADLTAFDCVLFVENVLALAQGVAVQDTTFDTYRANLEHLRYRGGVRDGYASRLHYFTDWIRDNAARGHVEDVTAGLPGAAPFDQTINFMSGHRASYRQLATDDAQLARIAEAERALNAHPLQYLPKARVAAAYDELQPGDVIATATDIAGLDVTHTGFVFRGPDGRTGFIHASSTGEVKVAPDLAEYLAGNRRQIGLLVARPLPPAASGR